MKKTLILLSLLTCCSVTNADLTIKTNDSIEDQLDLIQVGEAQQIKFGDDILATTINYQTFEVGLEDFVRYMIELRKNNDFMKLCVVHDMAHEYLINNIKYATEYNKQHPNLPYEKLFTLIVKDPLENKKGCDGDV